MPRHDRSAVAKMAIKTLLPLIKSNGVSRDSLPDEPSSLVYTTGDFLMCLTDGYVVGSEKRRPPLMLDVWIRGENKVLSVAWEPIRIIRFKPGEWIALLAEISAPRTLH